MKTVNYVVLAGLLLRPRSGYVPIVRRAARRTGEVPETALEARRRDGSVAVSGAQPGVRRGAVG